MTGPAVQSGSAFGGFIEGAFGGFERTTEFRRRRRLEQQVAEQLRARTERQGRQDEETAETLRRNRELEDLNLLLEHGIARTPGDAGAVQEVPESVSNLREAVGDNLTRQGTPDFTARPGARSLPPGFTRVGLSAAEREAEERSGFLGKVAEFMALSPEEREAAIQDPETQRALDELGIFDDVATAPPPGSSVRFGVTGTGGRTITGGTREQADQFAREFPHTPSPRTPGDLSVPAAFQILKDRYTIWNDDGSFNRYEKPLPTILAEARELARGGQMTPRPPQPEEVEEEGPGFFKKLGQTIRGLGRPEVSSGESPLDRFLQVPGAEEERGPRFMEAQMRALELEEEGKTRDEIRRIMQSEGYRVQ